MIKLLARLLMTPGGYMVWVAMGNPMDWEWTGYDNHVIRHKPTRMELAVHGEYWMDSTPRFTSFIDRRFLWRRYKRMCNRSVLVKMTQLAKET